MEDTNTLTLHSFKLRGRNIRSHQTIRAHFTAQLILQPTANTELTQLQPQTTTAGSRFAKRHHPTWKCQAGDAYGASARRINSSQDDWSTSFERYTASSAAFLFRFSLVQGCAVSYLQILCSLVDMSLPKHSPGLDHIVKYDI